VGTCQGVGRALFGLILGLTAPQAYSQTAPPDVDAIRSSVAAVLSLASFGTITLRDAAPGVARQGGDYQIRLPLGGFSMPADATADAVVRPLGSGVWDLLSMTLPAAGSLKAAAPNAPGAPVAFVIGEQSIHGRVDLGVARPSAFAASFSAISLHASQGDLRTEQALDRYVTDGTWTTDQAGRLSFTSRATATNWHLRTQGANGFSVDELMRTAAGHFSVEGLDREQGARLSAAARALVSGAGASDGSSDRRQTVRALVDALSGLLTRFEAEETLDDLHFSFGAGSRGSIDRVRLEMTGDAAGDRLNARLGVGLDELAVTTLPPETAALLPHHFEMSSVLTAVSGKSLMALLRAAAADDVDPDVLHDQLAAALGEPGARVGIETATFDCGPMRVAGSARIAPLADGQLSATIHISATGMDELLALVQRDPAAQQLLPMLLMAKGRGQPAGNAIVWDFSFGV
jgi:hypothetical protein